MVKIKEEKIAELMFDIWHNSRELKNPVMVGEYISKKLKEVINYTDSSTLLKEKYKKVTFNEWLELMGYYKKKDKWYNKHGYLRGYRRLMIKYECMMSDL